jgi:hypothetical protein
MQDLQSQMIMAQVITTLTTELDADGRERAAVRIDELAERYADDKPGSRFLARTAEALRTFDPES